MTARLRRVPNNKRVVKTQTVLRRVSPGTAARAKRPPA